MHNVVMIIPAASGIGRDRVEAVYASVFPSLVSCLPSLLDAGQEPMSGANGRRFVGSCSLWFPSERDMELAFSSREWVELIDETADVFDWDAVEFIPADTRAQRELIPS